MSGSRLTFSVELDLQVYRKTAFVQIKFLYQSKIFFGLKKHSSKISELILGKSHIF